MHLADEAVVVRVPVRDDHADDRGVPARDPGNGQELSLVPERAIERQAHVEHETSTAMLDLNAATAYVMSPAVDADAHASNGLQAGTEC
jgi:hypothetical protein